MSLIKKIYLIYFLIIIVSFLLFYYQFLNKLVSIEFLIKIFAFVFFSCFLLLITYKKTSNLFDSILNGIGVSQRIATPTFFFIFLGGFSIALAIVFIAFLEALGLLFVVDSLKSLILNILALVSFFWLAFILFMGWDFVKISSFVSQYSMLKNEKKSFLKSILFFRKKSIRDAFLVFAIIDLVCKDFKKFERIYYKNLLYPVKIWTACLILQENKSASEALTEAFLHFKNNLIKPFNSHSFLFFILIAIPLFFSLGITLTNFNYFNTCIQSNCFFTVVFFLIFISLGFFFSYSISISIESAYFVKILNDIKENKFQEKTQKVDIKINFIEKESLKKVLELKGNFLDIFRVYL
ncbi:MAG: hypothetical protein QXK49_00585 [Candidatus Aenigmatarchaeota archaeon]